MTPLAQLVFHRAPHILHMQQALKQMNIQLSEVLSDITGVTGQAIVRAIVAGEREPVRLTQLRNPGCKHTEAEIEKALTGSWQPAQIFILQQNLQLYDFYTAQPAACDSEMERYYQAMEARHEKDAPLPALPRAKPGSKSKNEPNFTVRAQLARIVGVDLVGVMGLSASSAQTISTELGTDMTRFPSVKHFCAWLALAPRNDISGGKVLRSRTLKVRSRANQAFRQAAESVARSVVVWWLLPSDAGAARAGAGDCGDGTQDRAGGLSLADDQGALPRGMCRGGRSEAARARVEAVGVQ